MAERERAVVEAARAVLLARQRLEEGAIGASGLAVNVAEDNLEQALCAYDAAPSPEPLPLAVFVLEQKESDARHMADAWSLREQNANSARNAGFCAKASADHAEAARQCRSAIEHLKELFG